MSDQPTIGDRSLKFVTEATVIAVVTAAFYFLGIVYVNGLCQGIDIDDKLLSFSPQDYLTMPCMETFTFLCLLFLFAIYPVAAYLILGGIFRGLWWSRLRIKYSEGWPHSVPPFKAKETGAEEKEWRPADLKKFDESLKAKWQLVESPWTWVVLASVLLFCMGIALFDSAGIKEGKRRLQNTTVSTVTFKNGKTAELIYVSKLGDTYIFQSKDKDSFDLVEAANVESMECKKPVPALNKAAAITPPSK